MNGHRFAIFIVPLCVVACAGNADRVTLADLRHVEAEIEEVVLEDSLEMAAQSYQRFLEETPEGRMTPEAMRRMADLQIEKAYGLIGTDTPHELPAPESAFRAGAGGNEALATGIVAVSEPEQAESDSDFEQRAAVRHEAIPDATRDELQFPDGVEALAQSGPQEAIRTYNKLLETYPEYERNDQVLYQLSRAYDEVGQPEDAMQVMQRLVTEYPYSKYIDEVQFRRGEYFFIRKKYLDAEDAYSAVIDMGSSTSYFELALYKMGWTLYKQELYEQALHRYIAMLDYRLSIGDDFDRDYEDGDGHRVADTFRVVSLSLSNIGGPEVIDDYFSAHGARGYADKIYRNLGEFYLSKLRYHDAASVYGSFIELNPFHRRSPHFNMQIVAIYTAGEFPLLVVESKREFASRYALQAEYWRYFNLDEAPEVVSFLQTNLKDLANHYHALYQNESLAEKRPAAFLEAQRWYREFLDSFPDDPESPPINYQFADLLLEHQDYARAAREYERTAYDYPPHEQSAAAGYAAIFAHREDLKVATGARLVDVKQETVVSSLRFADTYPDHEQAPVVLGAAAEDLYEMKDFPLAIAAAEKLIQIYSAADAALLRSAWAVIANASIDTAAYVNAENAYTHLLVLTAPDDESLEAVIEGLAASIYKQGEQAQLLEDYRGAADHFLRIKDVAPGSSIRAAAEYDAAAALIYLKDWSLAASTLEDFRSDNADHELLADATRQLASVYREDGQLARSAGEYERVATESEDPQLSREALLLAGDLYEQADSPDSALNVYLRYVAEFPRPLDLALETRTRIAEMHEANGDSDLYREELRNIVAINKSAGEEQTDRSRYLAAQAALVLTEQLYEQFAELKLVLPFEQSLAEKQNRMDVALAAFEDLVNYEVAEVTAAATFYIAEIYFEFSNALLQSERPADLDAAQMADYEMVIEEEAFPFEEQAIDVHEENVGLLAVGVYNVWVQSSLDKLAVLMPGRYAKYEASSGFVGSIDKYAYRTPISAQIDVVGQNDANTPRSDSDSQESPDSLPATAQIVDRDRGYQ